ncbi:MAG TPA: phosphoheptose isomerase, partial [Akkermansia sp.]|nr:phosphoheptose isomerase [Akkermansia sp.]
GNSRNIVLAMELARRMGVRTVALTGRGGGEKKEAADFCIAVPSEATNNIQEMHIAVGHLVCELVEREIYGG